MNINRALAFIKEPFWIIAPCVLGTTGMIATMLYLTYRTIFSATYWIQKSLIYATLIRYLNYSIFPIDKSISNLTSYLILFAGFVRACHELASDSRLLKRDHVLLFIYFIFILMFALMSSAWFFLSFMKLFVFFIGFFTVITVTYENKNFDWLTFFAKNYALMVFATLLLLPAGEIAYHPGLGLKGIFNHSQANGVILAIFWALFVSYAFSLSRIKWYHWLIILVGLFEIFLTKTRTAIGSLLLGLVAAVILYDIKSPLTSFFKVIRFLLSGKGILTVLVTITLFVFFQNSVIDFLESFLYKRVEDRSTAYTTDDFLYSRKILYDKQIENFNENKWIGIGFGMPSSFNPDEEHFGVTYLPGTSIPLSYPVEKGVLITALLEETGIIGMSLFIVFLLSLSLRYFKNNKSFFANFLFFSALFVNLGEFIFFTSNGLGIFVWTAFAISNIYLNPLKKGF